MLSSLKQYTYTSTNSAVAIWNTLSILIESPYNTWYDSKFSNIRPQALCVSKYSNIVYSPAERAKILLILNNFYIFHTYDTYSYKTAEALDTLNKLMVKYKSKMVASVLSE